MRRDARLRRRLDAGAGPGLRWFAAGPGSDRALTQLLGDLATGRIPLTHQGLHAVPSWRTVAYLRDLLMTCGVLPTVDKQLLHYETWLHRRLGDLGDSPHLRWLRQFAV